MVGHGAEGDVGGVGDFSMGGACYSDLGDDVEAGVDDAVAAVGVVAARAALRRARGVSLG